jgi:integrase
MALAAAARGTRERYLQWFKPTRAYRFRRAVPTQLRPIIGQSEWTETLSRDLAEAKRQLRAHIERTDRILALAEAGNWPEINEDEIEAVAEGWWRLFQLERSRLITNPQGLPSWPNGRERLDDINSELWALASDDDLSRSVRRFISGPRQWRHPQAPDAIRDRVESFLGDPKRSARLSKNTDAMGRLLRHCQILHHHAASGYVGEGDERGDAIGRILDMIERLEIDPRQILAAIEGRTVAPVSPGNTPLASLSPVPAIYSSLSLGAVAAEDESDLISRWAKENEIGVRGVYQARLDMAKFVKLIEHDDATRVSPEDIIRFKEQLGRQSLSPATINRYLSAIKSPLSWARRNLKIGSNPGVGIVYNAKGKKRIKRRGYDGDQARTILLAAREEELAHRRWIPWVCAFTGYRLDEVAGRDVSDVQRIGRYWVLDIPDGKTDGSARKIPLHPALIREGFIDYVKSLSPNGPLFPDLTPDLHGRRAGSATKRIGRWLRQVQEQTGVLLVEQPRFAPNHSWRHRFKSEARRVGMDEEIHDALTGHREGKVSRDYGEYYVDAVLGPAIESMLSPFDIKPADTVAENARDARAREGSARSEAANSR